MNKDKKQLTPEQKKKLLRMAKVVADGDVAVTEHLFEIEEKIEKEVSDVKAQVSEMKKDVKPNLQDILDQVKGKKGDKGDKGDRGDKGEKGDNGKDGIAGKPGRDGLKGQDGTKGDKGDKGEDGTNGKDGSPDAPKQIKSKLESLSGDDRLSKDAVKGLEILDRIPDIERIAKSSANSLPPTTTFVNGKRAKNINFTGATVSYANDTATVAVSAGSGTVTQVTATAPITSTGGTTPVISTSMNTNKLIGRSSGGAGVMEEVAIGTGLSLSGGTLTNTGSSGITGSGSNGRVALWSGSTSVTSLENFVYDSHTVYMENLSLASDGAFDSTSRNITTPDRTFGYGGNTVHGINIHPGNIDQYNYSTSITGAGVGIVGGSASWTYGGFTYITGGTASLTGGQSFRNAGIGSYADMNIGGDVIVRGGEANGGNYPYGAGTGGSVNLQTGNIDGTYPTYGNFNFKNHAGTIVTQMDDVGGFAKIYGFNAKTPGVCIKVALARNSPSQASAISLRTMYTTPVNAGVLVRISWTMWVNQAASTSSVLGGANGIQFTSIFGGVTVTTPASATSTTNTVFSTILSGVVLLGMDENTPLKYSIGYTSVGTTPMQYGYGIITELVTP